MDGTILIADDDRTIRTVLTQALTRAGCRVHATASLATLLRWVEEGKGDLVVTDVMMPDGNGIEMLPRIHQIQPNMPVIVISAQNTIMTAIQATEAEAYDYLPKPFDLPDLLTRARKALETRRQRPAAQAARETTGASMTAMDSQNLPLVGRTPAMQDLYRLVARVMNADLPVLISGESGTGKSLVAKALHDFSDRRGMPYVSASAQDFATDHSSEPRESAGEAQFARASRGTFVIDGLGDFDQTAQARLVRLLDKDIPNAPRIVAIADSALTKALEAGTFRSDLFYRLSGVTLDLPPLRERIEDIAPLAEHFLTRAARDLGDLRRFSDGALELMRKNPWPGNVRQLENVVKRLVITGQELEISPSELETVLGSTTRVGDAHLVSEAGTLSESVSRHVRRYFELHGVELPPPGVYQRILREVEGPLLEVALEYTGGNQARCADLLGINRNTLRKKTLGLDIHVARRRKLM